MERYLWILGIVFIFFYADLDDKIAELIEGKHYTSDIRMKYEAGEYCAYYNEKRFTGKVYSLDESCYMVFKNGVPIEAIGLHSNGAKLFEADFPFSKTNIWIYNKKGKGLIKAVYENEEWNYYNMLKTDTIRNTIPWISPWDCVSLLNEYYMSISMIESSFNKLPDIDYYEKMPRK